MPYGNKNEFLESKRKQKQGYRKICLMIKRLDWGMKAAERARNNNKKTIKSGMEIKLMKEHLNKPSRYGSPWCVNALSAFAKSMVTTTGFYPCFPPGKAESVWHT